MRFGRFYRTMGRSYKRKTQKINPETLKYAVFDVQKGMSLRQASRIHGVPRTSLRRQSKLNNVQSEASEPVAPAEGLSNEISQSYQLAKIVIRNTGKKRLVYLLLPAGLQDFFIGLSSLDMAIWKTHNHTAS